jgi:hypothetical protein
VTGVSRSHGRSPWREAYARQGEILLAAISRPSASECATNLKRNSKGAVEIDVLARGSAAATTAYEAETEFDRLCAKYPYPLEGAVSPPAETQAVGDPLAGLPAGGRSRGRGKAATA